MIQNCKASEFDKLFNVSSIKIPSSGASYKEINDNLIKAFESNSNIKCVLRCLDTTILTHDKDYQVSRDLPTYLYDDSLINDVNYIFNKNMFLDSVKSVIFTLKGRQPLSFDEYCNCEDVYEYGKNEILKVYNRPNISNTEKEFTNNDMVTVKENLLQNVTELIDMHPETTFYLFFPPYSIFRWDMWTRNGEAKYHLEAEKYAIEILLQHDNIKLFSFSDDFSLVTNHDNYRDTLHYNEDINSQIIQWISSGEHQITKDNYIDYCNKVYEFYTTYDYDTLFE